VRKSGIKNILLGQSTEIVVTQGSMMFLVFYSLFNRKMNENYLNCPLCPWW
jgi:hypothetical protein